MSRPVLRDLTIIDLRGNKGAPWLGSLEEGAEHTASLVSYETTLAGHSRGRPPN